MDDFSIISSDSEDDLSILQDIEISKDQDLKYDNEYSELIIGDNNTIREYCRVRGYHGDKGNIPIVIT